MEARHWILNGGQRGIDAGSFIFRQIKWQKWSRICSSSPEKIRDGLNLTGRLLTGVVRICDEADFLFLSEIIFMFGSTDGLVTRVPSLLPLGTFTPRFRIISRFTWWQFQRLSMWPQKLQTWNYKTSKRELIMHFFFPSHMKLKKPQIHDNETPRQKSVNSITTNQPSQLTAFLPSWAEPHR